MDEVELKVRIPKQLFRELDDYRFAGRFPSRKAALVNILRIAFARETATEPGLFDRASGSDRSEGDLPNVR